MKTAAPPNGVQKIVATYDYTDEGGNLLYQTLRLEPGDDGAPKTFRQRRPNRRGGWINDIKGVRRVLYGLPELLANAERAVFIVEGEKDVATVRDIGLVATTNAMGSGTWLKEYARDLQGRQVIILPDNDEPGRQHAKAVADSLIGVAASVRILELPGLAHKGDVTDWLTTKGNDKQKLLELAGKARPYQPDGSAIWQEPVHLNETLAAEPFPIDILPASLAEFVQDVAAAKNCPVDFVAAPLMAIAGGAIGARRALEIKPGWAERPLLYMAVVGEPGSGKTPSLNAAARPVYAEQARHMAAYKEKKAVWQEGDQKRKPPVAERIHVVDTTTEKLACILAENPSGVALIRDELSGWMSSMDQYKAKGKGADRQFFLSVWAGEPVAIDRKNQDEPLLVPHPFAAIVGGIPPALLTALRGERRVADGFIDRILFAYPEPFRAKKETWACVSEEGQAQWEAVLKYLWKLEPKKFTDGSQRPFLVRLTASGRSAWESFTEALATEQNREDLPDPIKGHLAKFRGYGARLALIVHYLRVATGEVQGEDVDGESVKRSEKLIAYFMNHAQKVHAALETDPKIADAKRILACLERNPELTDFTRADLFQHVRRYFKRQDALDKPLELLVDHRYLRSYLPDPTGRPGPRSERYVLNPLWRDVQRPLCT
jgi:Protein of unknown function (DUF3987)/Toprim domain